MGEKTIRETYLNVWNNCYFLKQGALTFAHNLEEKSSNVALATQDLSIPLHFISIDDIKANSCDNFIGGYFKYRKEADKAWNLVAEVVDRCPYACLKEVDGIIPISFERQYN